MLAFVLLLTKALWKLSMQLPLKFSVGFFVSVDDLYLQERGLYSYDSYVRIYITIGPMSYGSLQGIHNLHWMLVCMYELIVYIYKR